MPLPRARARPQDHPESLGGLRVPVVAQGGRARAGGRLQRGHRLSSAPGRALQASARPGGCASRVDIPPSCPRLPAAFVFLGLHKMAAAALRHFVCEAGGQAARRGRETTVRPLPRVAWTEPSSSPRPSSALAAAALGLAPAHVLARPSGNPGPSPSPAGPLAAPQPSLTSRRRCCEAEPRRAVIKAMLLEGVLGIPGAGTDGSRNDSRLSGRGWAAQTRCYGAGSFLGHAGDRSGALSPPLARPRPHLPKEPLGSLVVSQVSGLDTGPARLQETGRGLPGGGGLVPLCSWASPGA